MGFSARTVPLTGADSGIFNSDLAFWFSNQLSAISFLFWLIAESSHRGLWKVDLGHLALYVIPAKEGIHEGRVSGRDVALAFTQTR
jgi:hypothetical protein